MFSTDSLVRSALGNKQEQTKDCRGTAKMRKIIGMKAVAAFLFDETTTRRLTLAFRTRCAVRSFESFEAARAMVLSGQVLAMVVDLRRRPEHKSEKDPVELIAQLHAVWPEIPIIGYVNFTPQRAQDILAAAHAGAAEIILGEFDELELIANKIVDMGTASWVAARVDAMTKGIVPPHLREFFLFSITNARYGMSVEGIVARLQKSRKTISNWLAAAELPPPARIVGWARVLVAARMLEDTTQSAEKVARELRLMSGAALRNLMRRYLRCTPDVLRQRGGFEHALELFVASLLAGREAEHAA